MSNIALTCLGKIAEYLAAPVGRQLGYLFCFNDNVETLKDEEKKLCDFKVGIQMQLDEATRNAEDIFQIVQTWLEDVGKFGVEAQNIIQAKDEFPKGCFNHWCLKLKSRHALSRTAKKKTPVIVELQKQGLAFQKVSCPAPPKPLIVPTSSTISLVSRKSMLNDIIKSLKNEEISMIGICGMGGVGKTTMMQEVKKKVLEESLFDEIAEAVVSQNINSIKIQSDIAEHVGLELKESSLEVRAGWINATLQGKKVLIILDDVWEGFDLQPLGIDLKGNKGCKILYTSRSQSLWMEFGSRSSFRNLAELILSECNSLQYVFSPWMARYLVHLHTLKIYSCESLKAVVHAEKGDGEYTSSILPQLKKIDLDELPAFESFCHIAHELEFPVLQHVFIRNCSKLKTLAPGIVHTPNLSGTVQHLHEDVSFPSLVKMELYGVQNMKEIWCGQLQVGSFRNLAELFLCQCNSLQYVLSPWMARYLVHLHTLEIYSCKSLKEVVRAEKEEDGQECTSSILPELKKIELTSLPAIESFCHISNDLELSVLKHVQILNCPKLKTFAPGFVRTPNLSGVMIDNLYDQDKLLWKGNLNDTILHYYEDQEQWRQAEKEEEENMVLMKEKMVMRKEMKMTMRRIR